VRVGTFLGMARRLSLAVVLCAAFFSVAERATAATPCWKNVLTDRYDGRLDRTYPVRCYREALRHVPADVDAYTSASDDIRRALLAALGSGSASGGATKTPATGTQTPATSARSGPVGALAAETASAKTILSPFVLGGILAATLVLAAAAKFVAQRRGYPKSTGSTRTAS
jgi:hypothetical protein